MAGAYFELFVMLLAYIVGQALQVFIFKWKEPWALREPMIP